MTIAHLRRSDSGQAVVELALFLPLFLLVMLGMMEVGNAWNAANKAAQAAHEGVEHVRRTHSLASGEVDAIVASVAGDSATSAISTIRSESVPTGRLATVTVTFDLPLITGPFLRLFSPFRSGTLRIERAATALLVP